MRRRQLRIGFDIGGVISKYPDVFLMMLRALATGGAELFVVTDMHDREWALRVLADNGFGMVPPENVHSADFAAYGEACKAVLLERLRLDVFLDDFPAYLAAGCPVRLQVLPDISRPYYADGWKTDGSEGDFGRRVRVEAYGRDSGGGR